MKKITESIANIEALLAMQLVQVKKVLSLQEAARYLNLSDAMLYKMTSERMIPHSKPSGKKIFFNREDLEAWALSNRVRTADEIGKEALCRGGRHLMK